MKQDVGYAGAQWSAFTPTRLAMGPDLEWLLDAALTRLLQPAVVAIVSSGGFARRLGYLDQVEAIVGRRARIIRFDDVAADPTVADAARFAAFVQQQAPDAVIAVGGGSVIDTAKIGCAFAGAGGPIEAAMRQGGLGLPQRLIPVIAVPTTAGTGSEATPYAVLRGANGRHIFAVSDRLFPDHGLVWTPFYATVPQPVIRDVACDALTHALESLWSKLASPASDALALTAIARLHRWLLPYYRDRGDPQAAEEVATAASLAGLAFATAFTTACHGLSFPVAERLGLSHGRACAVLMAPVAEANAGMQRPEIDAMLQSLGLSSASALPDYLRQLRADLDDTDTLSSLGIDAAAASEEVRGILDHAHWSMLKNNRVPLGRPALEKIIGDAW